MKFFRMGRFLSFLSLAGILLIAACRQSNIVPQKFGGTWTMNLGDRTFLVLALTENGDKITGTLSRPSHFQMEISGMRFSQITSDEVAEVITSATIKDDHLRFETANPNDKNDTSDYELAITGKDQASLKIIDAPFDAWPITRIPSGSTASVFTGWDPKRFYPNDDNTASNIEMKKIYEEDQKPRQNPAELTPARWKVLDLEDAERRKQTAKLLADGQLRTGEDFNKAAFIFQHGSTPDDFLLAHTLAMIAVAKGDESALWIGTATLDRYLHSVGKPQIYGTQFKPGKDANQEPFNRNLISDSLRRELGVPTLAAQVAQFKLLTGQSGPAARKP